MVFLPFALRPLILEWKKLRKHLVYLSITSLLGITLFNTLIYLAGHTTTALNLSLISITFPIFIVILSRILYGEPISFNKSMGIVMVVSGILFLLTKGDISILKEISFAVGDIWMMAAAITFAVYSILLKHKPADVSIWSFQLSTFILGLVFLTPFYIWDLKHATGIDFDINIIVSILYVGVFASLFAFVLWNNAVAKVGPAKAGMVYYTLPIFSGMLAYWFLEEHIGFWHLGSAVLIVPGILIANVERKKANA